MIFDIFLYNFRLHKPGTVVSVELVLAIAPHKYYYMTTQSQSSWLNDTIFKVLVRNIK